MPTQYVRLSLLPPPPPWSSAGHEVDLWWLTCVCVCVCVDVGVCLCVLLSSMGGRFSADVFVAAGVSKSQVVVVPEPVDTDFFNPYTVPGLSPYSPNTFGIGMAARVARGGHWWVDDTRCFCRVHSTPCDDCLQT